MITHTLNYCGVEMDVTGTYYTYKVGSYELPPEPEEFEIEKITINGADVTELLEEQMETIETEILENMYR